MPRPRQMPRPDEKEMDAEDVELLTKVENMALSPEEQELIQRARADLSKYGKLTTSERKALKALKRHKKSNPDAMKEYRKYTTLTPEGRAEFAKTVRMIHGVPAEDF